MNKFETLKNFSLTHYETFLNFTQYSIDLVPLCLHEARQRHFVHTDLCPRCKLSSEVSTSRCLHSN